MSEKTATAVSATIGPTPGTVWRRAATLVIVAGWTASVFLWGHDLLPRAAPEGVVLGDGRA